MQDFEQNQPIRAQHTHKDLGRRAGAEAEKQGLTEEKLFEELDRTRQQIFEERYGTTMKEYKIAAIPGDGIGKEVLPEGLKVLQAVAEKTRTFQLTVKQFPWGCEHYLETGEVMAEDSIDTLRGFDAIYFGAGGHPEVPDYVSAWELIFVIRHAFDQYVNLRPIKLLPGVATPLANVTPEDIDFVIVRENTEGEFAGPGGLVHAGQPHAVAVQTSVFTRQGVAQVARYAFQTARERRRHVTNVTKSNAVQHSLVFWDRVVGEVRADYPDVAYETMYVDAAAMKFIQEPGRFDVILTTNLFGDILSDLGAAMMGSIGLAASGNINPDPGRPSMFEPFHGSAPDIAGRGVANPVGAIWAGAMMLDHLGEREAAGLVLKAISQVLESGLRTPDLGGSATTSQMGDAIARTIDKSTL
jgi:tartrate dehydrogenase/decarboxylase/D-malate dehydrogenase